MITPRVYVGTYAKYNSGNIAGRWIDLAECDSYADFLANCKKAHKDERDPEFMIQDNEGFPDGLSCGEWLSEKEFTDVKEVIAEEAKTESAIADFTIVDYSAKAIAVTGNTKEIKDELKALGGRFNPKLTCGPGWVFPKTKEADVRALLGGSPATERTESVKKDNSDKYVAPLNEWLSTIKKDDVDYYKKNNIGALKLNEGYLLIGKSFIENKFCFSDEGPEYEFYKSLCGNEKKLAQYFLDENLSGADKLIEKLENKDKRAFIVKNNYPAGTCEIRIPYYYCDEEELAASNRELTMDERRMVADAYRWEREKFKARLNTYLKRYGVSKLHIWSYWADA